MSAGAAGSSLLDEAELLASLEDEVEVDLLDDKTVQEVLAKQVDLRKYAAEVESGLRSLEGASIKDYIAESESLAGLHTQIRSCDTVLDSMESMLRGFQGDRGQARDASGRVHDLGLKGLPGRDCTQWHVQPVGAVVRLEGDRRLGVLLYNLGLEAVCRH